MKRSEVLVYVGGPLSNNECEYIKNLNKNIQTSIGIKRNGFSVVTPGNDFLSGLLAGDYDYNDYADNSLEIMKRCDVLYLDSGWEKSKGCLKERDVAEEYNIPVTTSIASLERMFRFIFHPRRLEDIE